MGFDASRFRHLSISDAAYEHDGIRLLTAYSPSLRGRGDLSLWLPPGASTLRSLPIVILLHGVYASHWSWFMQGGAHLTAAEMIAQGELPPMAIACPSDGLYGEGSGYLPLLNADFEGWIGEVPDILCGAAPCCDAFSPLFLAGLSMGGYGALRIGMKYPNRYRAISAHSPITAPEQFRQFFEPEDAKHFLAMETEEWQLLYWAGQHREKLPPLRFDCGRGDTLFSANEEMHQALMGSGVSHSFEAFDGEHDWPYWYTNIRRSLRFFAQHA